jgi:hypothetical protein
MPRYMTKVTFSEAGATGLLSVGFATRVEQIRDLVAQWGGTLEDAYYLSSGQVVLISSYDEPQNLALRDFQGMAGGAWLVPAEYQEIYTGEEMDTALTSQTVAYRPPGS